jgi:Family of unknown function (DUF5681)
MQFQKGQSGNPAGRRKGLYSPTRLLAEAMLASDAEAIIRKTIDQAKEGKSPAQRICWDRIAPLDKQEPVACEFPPIEKVADAGAFIAALINAVGLGELAPREAREIAKLVDTYLRTVELTTVDARLTELEEARAHDADNQGG